MTRQALARAYLAKITSAVQAPNEHPSNSDAACFALDWTVLLALALVSMILSLRWMMARIERRYHSAIDQIESETFRLVRAGWIWIGVRFIVRLVIGIASLAIFYAYLQIVLNYFPWTRPVSVHLRALILAPLLALGGELAAAIPSLVIVLLIVVAARYVTSLARFFFSAIEKGTIKVAAFDVDWSHLQPRTHTDHRFRRHDCLSLHSRIAVCGLQGRHHLHRRAFFARFIVIPRQHHRGLR